MPTFFYKIRLPLLCVVLSILVHILFICASRLFGIYDFSAPVNPPRAVLVTLAGPVDAVSEAAKPESLESDGTDHEDVPIVKQPPPEQEGDSSIPAINPEQPLSGPETVEAPVIREIVDDLSVGSDKTATAVPVDTSHQANPVILPMRSGNEFLAAKYEKLTYQISMLGERRTGS